MRRAAPVVLLVALAALLGWYVIYARRVVQALRQDAATESVMYARVWQALSDTTEESSAAALLDLSSHIRGKGVPVILLDADGNPTAWDNLDVESPSPDDLREMARQMDAENAPVALEGGNSVHYGNTLLVRGLRIVPLVQAGLIGLLGIAALVALRARGRAERERTWAGMAREAAHQLGTPLTSLSGWVELLGERDQDPLLRDALVHIHGDLERLDRVAHRFERIGTPPRREPVDVDALCARLAEYFRARAPKLNRAVEVRYLQPEEPVEVHGDAVLLEWALESLLKNALDALAGRGGTVTMSLHPLPEGGARVRIADDGPGIPRDQRAHIFEAGFSTKVHGWGIGLSLAQRIVEENHDGRLELVPTDRGATFDVILP
ncbi:MAG: sensor histidine kinase [Gemmatimonadaceae bacterium]